MSLYDILTTDEFGNHIEITPNNFILQKSNGVQDDPACPICMVRKYDDYAVPKDSSEVRNCCTSVLENNQKWRIVRLSDSKVIHITYRKDCF